MSIASVATQQTSTTAGANDATATSTSTSTTSSSGPLSSLSANFGNFLKLLMTQLKNQDPTSPLDTNQFTTELVQFSSVEQQINTNSSLTQLIQLTQGGAVLQSSAMLGKTVTVSSDHVPLQSGKGQVNFTATAAGPMTITVSDASGKTLRSATLDAVRGDNTWTWDGTDNGGGSVADGSYKVSVTAPPSGTGAATTAVPFTVTGTATGVTKSGSTLDLELGALSTDFSNVRTVGK